MRRWMYVAGGVVVILLIVAGWWVVAHGHLEFTGRTPILAACGVNPEILTAGDSAGAIRVGTGVTVLCSVTFDTPWVGKPVCILGTDDPKITGGGCGPHAAGRHI